MRKGLVAAMVLTCLTAVGCGDGSRPDLVVTGTPPATPYAGPLTLPHKEAEGDSVRAVTAGAGAAGRALECDGEIYSGGAGDAWSEGDGGSTPEEGLRAYFDMDQPELPDHGYRVERRADGRVLFSYDVDGRTKVAVVVAKDRPHRPGWGPETSASCDPAELPASFTDSTWYEIWTDRNGHRAPVTRVHSSAGDAHCGWQSAHFLSMGRGENRKLYARDPGGVLGGSMLTSAYESDALMPVGARDTGYRFQDWDLWLTPDESKAYVRTPHGVEAWPEVKDGLGCK
ncbi:hypothetical protein ACFVXA_22595 [Streptomyces sp. NPDC058246]|uniref:hypothetical protein n=1 Tax=unclassified Streptomyces TaxID=2593676 RepID=UPI0036EED1CD